MICFECHEADNDSEKKIVLSLDCLERKNSINELLNVKKTNGINQKVAHFKFKQEEHQSWLEVDRDNVISHKERFEYY